MSLTEIVSIKGYIQTTYLVVYPDKLLLLDAGCRCDVDHILEYITHTLERPLSQLKTVVVTHMHPDHAGGAELLRQKTKCKLVSFEADKPWYRGVKGRVKHLNDLALTYYVAKKHGKPITKIWYNPILRLDKIVRDGDTVPHFEDWQILETPGHTDCDLSLWHSPSKQIYTGDLILKIKHKLLSPYLISLPQAYVKSLHKVKALKPNKVLLAHGEKVELTDEDFDGLILRAPQKMRKKDILQGLTIKLPQLKSIQKKVDIP